MDNFEIFHLEVVHYWLMCLCSRSYPHPIGTFLRNLTLAVLPVSLSIRISSRKTCIEGLFSTSFFFLNNCSLQVSIVHSVDFQLLEEWSSIWPLFIFKWFSIDCYSTKAVILCSGHKVLTTPFPFKIPSWISRLPLSQFLEMVLINHRERAWKLNSCNSVYRSVHFAFLWPQTIVIL